jgi:hypothetical protein
VARRAIAPTTARREEPRLCVAVLTAGDLDGARLTTRAVRLYHPEVARRGSFVVVDRGSAAAAAGDVQALEAAAVRYLPLPGAAASAARDRADRWIDADVVCFVDVYALLEPGALAAAVARLEAHPDVVDDRSGLLACRRDAWPLAPHTEGIASTRPPPASDPFGCFDAIFCLNLDGATDRWHEAARRHERLGIAARVRRFAGVATPDNRHRGIASSFRLMIAEAARRGWEHLLVLEDDAVFLDDALSVMRAVAAELDDHAWDLCYLGACVWSQEFAPLEGSAVLQACGPVTCTHAVAFHRRAYDRLLGEIPAGGDDFDAWLEEYVAVDQYLSRRIADGAYRALITSPRVASQPNLLDHPDADAALGSRYVI